MLQKLTDSITKQIGMFQPEMLQNVVYNWG